MIASDYSDAVRVLSWEGDASGVLWRVHSVYLETLRTFASRLVRRAGHRSRKAAELARMIERGDRDGVLGRPDVSREVFLGCARLTSGDAALRALAPSVSVGAAGDQGLPFATSFSDALAARGERGRGAALIPARDRQRCMAKVGRAMDVVRTVSSDAGSLRRALSLSG